MCTNIREAKQQREERERKEAAQLYRESIAATLEDVTDPNELAYFYYFIRAKLGLQEEV